MLIVRQVVILMQEVDLALCVTPDNICRTQEHPPACRVQRVATPITPELPPAKNVVVVHFLHRPAQLFAQVAELAKHLKTVLVPALIVPLVPFPKTPLHQVAPSVPQVHFQPLLVSPHVRIVALEHICLILAQLDALIVLPEHFLVRELQLARLAQSENSPVLERHNVLNVVPASISHLLMVQHASIVHQDFIQM